MTPDLPPEPPPPIELTADAPTITVPRPVLRWYEERDIYADLVLAWGLDQQTDAVMARTERDEALWLADQRGEEVQRLRLRPTWPVVVGLVVVGSAASVYAWERVR